MKEHPNYGDLYEPWSGNNSKCYDHKMELEYNEDANFRLLCDSGLYFAKPVKKPKIESVDKEDLKQIKKNGVVQVEDLMVA